MIPIEEKTDLVKSKHDIFCLIVAAPTSDFIQSNIGDTILLYVPIEPPCAPVFVDFITTNAKPSSIFPVVSSIRSYINAVLHATIKYITFVATFKVEKQQQQ